MPGKDLIAKWTAALGRPYVRGGNKVTALIDGPETFRAMHEAIRNTDKVGFIYLLAWWLDVDLPLLSEDKSSTLRNLLAAASGRGVEIRAMVWKQVFNGETNEGSVAFINSLKTGRAVLDDYTWMRGVALVASHHQKVLLVKTRQGLVGFCGGIDINADRIMSDQKKSPGSPLHDVHCKIEGPSVYDLLNVFKQRWFGYGGLASGIHLDQRVGVGEKIPPAQGEQYVRIARTFNYVGKSGACQANRSVRSTLMNSIGKATRFIYIEDQYMINLEAARLLAKITGRVQHLTILVTHFRLSDNPEIWDWQAEFVNELMKGTKAMSTVRIFIRSSPTNSSPLGRHTYVHAKTWIIDDELAVIGSANLDNRGWSGDNQVNACIFDEPASSKKPSFAQRLRMRLWSEHLGVPESQVIDGIGSADLWTDRKRAPQANIAPWGEKLEGVPDLPTSQKVLAVGNVLSGTPGTPSGFVHGYADLSADNLKICPIETPRAPGDAPDWNF
jgi:phosphatidylserine/phosphatidylglycerophosphate/cardiolipin synthase-like enzyme